MVLRRPGNEPQVDGAMARVELQLPGEPGSVRSARRLVSRTLLDWALPHLQDAASLLTSELVTNAVLHAKTGISVELYRHGAVLRVTVRDGSPQPAERRRHAVTAGTGRGLGLLTVLATDWRSEPSGPPYRKAVWFELPLGPAAVP